MLHANGAHDPDAARVWATRIPTKVKFFGWLLLKERLNCRAHLFHTGTSVALMNALANTVQTLLRLRNTSSTPPLANARQVWDLAQINVEQGLYKLPWFLGQELQLPAQVGTDVILVVLWHIWKARNALIFDRTHSTASRVINDIDSWSCRFRTLKPALLCCGNIFSSACNSLPALTPCTMSLECQVYYVLEQ